MSTRVLRSKTIAENTSKRTRRQTSLPGDEPETAEVATRMYSDVVASRPPSPRVREENPIRHPVEPVAVMQPLTDIGDPDSSSSEPDENNGSPWITVQRKRARSLDSAKKSRYNKNLVQFNTSTRKLSTEQEKAVKAATEALTSEQRERVARRQDVLDVQSEEDDEEPSRDKGKTVDPREWGNAGISRKELNPEIQAAMIDAYNM